MAGVVVVDADRAVVSMFGGFRGNMLSEWRSIVALFASPVVRVGSSEKRSVVEGAGPEPEDEEDEEDDDDDDEEEDLEEGEETREDEEP